MQMSPSGSGSFFKKGDLNARGSTANGPTYDGGAVLAVDVISWLGSQIDSNVTAVTDITDPAGTGGWTELLNVNQACLIEQPSGSFSCWVDLNETAGNAVALQVLIDGEMFIDTYSIKDTVDRLHNAVGFTNKMIEAKQSFVVRAARVGSIIDTGTKLAVPSLYVHLRG